MYRLFTAPPFFFKLMPENLIIVKWISKQKKYSRYGSNLQSHSKRRCWDRSATINLKCTDQTECFDWLIKSSSQFKGFNNLDLSNCDGQRIYRYSKSATNFLRLQCGIDSCWRLIDLNWQNYYSSFGNFISPLYKIICLSVNRWHQYN